ncbi:8023_t:CDS:2 [Entrophospora sp. SA101]|nr:8023_t:CDS:2 [Entrophospora sp. SA101]
MAKKKLAPIHPGEILREELLIPLNISPQELAQGIKVPKEQQKELKRFKNRELEELANELELPPKSPYKNIQKLLRRKLKILLDAEKWQDLQIFPNSNPEKLRKT